MFLTAKSAVPQVLPGVDIAAGEQVLMEVSRKFTHQAVADMAYRAGQLIQVGTGEAAEHCKPSCHTSLCCCHVQAL